MILLYGKDLAMDDTILGTIKKLLGIPTDYDVFDVDIIIHINTVITILNRIGVGPTEGFAIDSTTTWSDYLSDDLLYESVKTYIYLKVRKIFDPPQGSAINSMDELIRELEFTLQITAD